MDKHEAFLIAKKGASFLSKNIKENGMFVYGYNKNGNELKGYSILRHAGCIWSLLEVYKEIIKETADADSIWFAIEKTIDYLRNRHVWRQEHRMIVSEVGYIKLGGVALTMLALLRYTDQLKKSKYTKTAEQLGLYIRWCTEEDGNLINHKVDMRNGQPTDFVSEYYPGECVLALCELHRKTKNKLALETATSITRFLKKNRDDSIDIVQDHWLLQALEYLHYNQSIFSMEFADYARMIGEHMITKNERYLSGVIRSTPIACRSEGLLSYYNISKDPSILTFVEELLEKQKQFQILIGEHAGAFVEGEDSKKIRCDYTQHNISSFIRFSKMKEE